MSGAHSSKRAPKPGSPDAIAAEIEARRASLVSHVNELQEYVKPVAVATRGLAKVKDLAGDAVNFATSEQVQSTLVGLAQTVKSKIVKSVN